MKTVCDFCKTEYTLESFPTTPVKCAVCGHVWRVAANTHRNGLVVVIAALCALLAAIVFAVVVIVRHQVDTANNKPLIAEISDVHTVIDAAGVSHFVVSGHVENRSDDIYGVPDLIIVSRDANGDPVAQQKFMPSATLLDAGASVGFVHTLSAPSTGVKKITVELGGLTE